MICDDSSTQGHEWGKAMEDEPEMEGTGRSRGTRTQEGGGTGQMVGHGSSVKDSRLQTEQRGTTTAGE